MDDGRRTTASKQHFPSARTGADCPHRKRLEALHRPLRKPHSTASRRPAVPLLPTLRLGRDAPALGLSRRVCRDGSTERQDVVHRRHKRLKRGEEAAAFKRNPQPSVFHQESWRHRALRRPQREGFLRVAPRRLPDGNELPSSRRICPCGAPQERPADDEHAALPNQIYGRPVATRGGRYALPLHLPRRFARGHSRPQRTELGWVLHVRLAAVEHYRHGELDGTWRRSFAEGLSLAQSR